MKNLKFYFGCLSLSVFLITSTYGCKRAKKDKLDNDEVINAVNDTEGEILEDGYNPGSPEEEIREALLEGEVE